MALEPARLLVEPLDRGELLVAAELRLCTADFRTRMVSS